MGHAHRDQPDLTSPRSPYAARAHSHADPCPLFYGLTAVPEYSPLPDMEMTSPYRAVVSLLYLLGAEATYLFVQRPQAVVAVLCTLAVAAPHRDWLLPKHEDT